MPTHLKRTDKAGQSYVISPGASPPLAKVQEREAQQARKPSKRAKTDLGDPGAIDLDILGDAHTGIPSELDRQEVLKTIQSLKATLRCLEGTIGIKAIEKSESPAAIPAMVCWDDVAHLLPSREDCETIIDCFFSDVSPHT